ncbi:telomerase-binding protein EST1A-like [Asterias amurensis]|uniref:telomerase-binding protein EST1A-like n=1 Tax=Asterias amurensis TaxID=7602 RepID=UPI003AB6BC8E
MANRDTDDDVFPKASRQKKDVRRPDLAIYKPGQSRLMKRPENEKAKSAAQDSNTSTKSPAKDTHTSQETSHVQNRKVKPEHPTHESKITPKEQKSARHEHFPSKGGQHKQLANHDRFSGSNRGGRNRTGRNHESKPHHHEKSIGDRQKEAEEKSKSVKVLDVQSVSDEQQPKVQSQHRWLGPQGRRKVAKEDQQINPPQNELQEGVPEIINAASNNAKSDSDTSSIDKSGSQDVPRSNRGGWVGKQEASHNKALDRPSLGANQSSASQTKTQAAAKQDFSHRTQEHGKGSNHQSRRYPHPQEGRRGSKDGEQHKQREDVISSRLNAKTSVAPVDKPSNNKSLKPKKPERPLYVSPKLTAGAAPLNELQVGETHIGDGGLTSKPLASEDTIETMVFTSRKGLTQNLPQRLKPTPKQNVPEKFTIENNQKVAMKSLLDLQVSPPRESTRGKLTQDVVRPQSSEPRPQVTHSSKRYSARRSRQRFNSESSTGSDNSQFVEPVAAKPEEWNDDLEHIDSRLHGVGLESNPSRSHEPISNRDSRHHQGTTMTQKNKSENQNLKKQLSSRQNDRGGRDFEEGKNNTERAKLSVTFSSQVHEVKITQEERSGGSESEDGRAEERRWSGRQNRQHERDSRRQHGAEQTKSENVSKGGGLIRIPQKPDDNTPTHHPSSQPSHPHSNQPYKPVFDQHYPTSQTKEDQRTKDRGRHSNKNLLWNPNKPAEKPALLSTKKPESSELQFYDPEHDGAGNEHGFDPRGQFQHSGYSPYYPPAQTMQVQPGLYPQQGFNQPMSWAEQVEAHTDSQTQARSSPSAPIHNYTGNFPPLGSSPNSAPAMPNPSSMQTSGSSHSALKTLQDTVRYENSLNNAVSRRFHGDESVQKVLKLSQELERMYECVILLDLEMCNKHNVEQLLWKTSYYQIIEVLRRQETESEEAGFYKTYLLHLLSHGNEFYNALLEKLESTYDFRLESRTGLDPLREEPRRTVKLALLSAQRCMIALGDIARYKELTNDTTNYGKARGWYLKAQHLAPRNGRPYNQLAILALYTRRKLDAVYYYMRSLAASNPFLTARESLMSLFEEIRRKIEHKEKAQIQAKLEKEKSREDENRRKSRERRGGRRCKEDLTSTRKEIWIATDGSSHDGSELQDDENDSDAELKRMTPVEVNKKFVLSFLNVQGKLFTKIGMEAFEFITDGILKEFNILLSHSPTPMTSTRLIQVMAVNMFAAHNMDESSRDDMRSLLQEQAIQLGLDMFGLLVNRCNQLLKEHLNSSSNSRELLSDDLLELLPGVKVYADWLMCHPSLWNPSPSCNEKPFSVSVDIWSCLAELLNTIKRIDTTVVKFVKKTDDNECQEILLPEDVQLSGFVPLLALPLQPVYVSKETNKLEAMDCVRIISLLLFGEYACGQETPLMAYDVTNKCYVSIVPEPIPQEEPGHARDQEDDDVILEESYFDDEEELPEESVDGSGDISGLRQKKEDLQRVLQEQQQKQAQRQATMDIHRQQRGLELEIRPLYLVPDTNGFIDHLAEIQSLLSCRKYKLVVPLVVINELDGLSKGSLDNQYEDQSHAHKVQEGAEQAILCLEEKFEQRNKYLRALTSKGTVLDTIAYRSEEVDFKGCNDDLILRCCLHYIDDRAKDFMPTDKEAPIRLYRDVVLLTNDRNLRVKALQQNVPVKDIRAFAKWAKV